VPKKVARKSRRAPTGGIELEAIVMCDSVAKDPNSGKPTLYGVFDNLNTTKLPTTSSFWCVARLLGGEGKQTLTIDISDENGDSILEHKPDLELTLYKDKKSNMIVQFDGVKLTKKGKHTLSKFAGRK
jgi:hypothetical protein